MNFDADFEIPNCTLTGRSDFETYTWGAYHLNVQSPISVAKCRETGMLYLCPRPNKTNRELMLQGILPESLRAYGEKTYNYARVDELRSNDFAERMAIFNHIFKDRPDKNALDVGTSGGAFMEAAQHAGWKVQGIEPYEGDVKLCESKGLDVVQGLAEKLPFADNTFLLVHTSHVFEHLEDPLVAAREALRVLKPGGMLFIEVPNQLDNFGFHRDMLFRSVSQRKRNISSIHHLWFFGRKTLRALFERAGYCDITIQNKFPKPFGGWRYPFSLASQLMASVTYGSYIIRGQGFKPE